jgi:hypothetical protein
MKMQRVSVTFERSVDVVLYVPENMPLEEIKKVADDLAFDGLRDWDPPEWEAVIGRRTPAEIPDEELTQGDPNKYGFRHCLSETLTAHDVLVINDDWDDMVSADDATWWIVKAETT